MANAKDCEFIFDEKVKNRIEALETSNWILKDRVKKLEKDKIQIQKDKYTEIETAKK